MPVVPPHAHPHKVDDQHPPYSPAGLPAGIEAAERKALGDTLRDAAADEGLAKDLCKSPTPTVQSHAAQAITDDHVSKLLGMDVAGIPWSDVGRVLRNRIETLQKYPADAPGHNNLMCSCD